MRVRGYPISEVGRYPVCEFCRYLVRRIGGAMLKSFAGLRLAIGLVGRPSPSVASEHKPVVPESPAGSVQFTIKICEANDRLQFWFNDQAKERWDKCTTPVPDVPVFLITDSGVRSEGKTSKDGVATV